MPAVVEHVRTLAEEGAALYCWSTAGGAYGEATAQELGMPTVSLPSSQSPT